MANKNLVAAKRAKNDEFYTQYDDIEREAEAYVEYDPMVFRDKVIYCNCDDPYESNFFRYFALKFNILGLKQLITTSYCPSQLANSEIGLADPSRVAIKFVINEVGDLNGDGSYDLADVAEQLRANKNNEWGPLRENGDFRSDECIELLQQADVVVTNPPFSLFREYVAQLVEYEKKFLIIGNKNAVTYKEIFPLIKENKIWLGSTGWSYGLWFAVPNSDGDIKLVSTPSVWFTNLEHGKRRKPLSVMSMADNLKYNSKIIKNPNSYKRYDNYDAIEVPYVSGIPSDYGGVMGVPISFLDKYCPEQFRIIGIDRYVEDNPNYGKRFTIDGKEIYARILLRHRRNNQRRQNEDSSED